VGLAVGVVSGADEGGEAVEEMKGRERGVDGFAGAAGDYGEGDATVLGFDLFQYFWDGLELGEEFEVEGFFAAGDRFDQQVQARCPVPRLLVLSGPVLGALANGS